MLDQYESGIITSGWAVDFTKRFLLIRCTAGRGGKDSVKQEGWRKGSDTNMTGNQSELLEYHLHNRSGKTGDSRTETFPKGIRPSTIKLAFPAKFDLAAITYRSSKARAFSIYTHN